MKFSVLGSGSRGNALVVQSAGRKILVDAGFSCRQLETRLATLGEDAEGLEALLLTHEHSDHVKGADVLLRRYGLPLFASAGTLAGASLSEQAVKGARELRSGIPFEVAGFQVEAFSIPHDAREPVGFVIEDSAGCRVGLAADLGCRTQLAWGRLHDLDALVLETNHDLQMLLRGPYPWHLKQRVAGRHGHLSNQAAAEGLAELVGDRLRHVVVYHLSQTNNQPALAAQAVAEQLDTLGSQAEVVLTCQNEPTPWVTLGEVE
jgi:phosphoribosyl 1,2-cyclic phosphodiesterase